LHRISGKDCVKLLCNNFGFHVVLRKGSHVMLKKEVNPIFIGTVVPLHDELKTGTLKNILRLAKVNEDTFWKNKK